jgi:hypothetical protein
MADHGGRRRQIDGGALDKWRARQRRRAHETYRIEGMEVAPTGASQGVGREGPAAIGMCDAQPRPRHRIDAGDLDTAAATRPRDDEQEKVARALILL